MLSEVKVQYKDIYAGTIDIVCGVDEVDCDIAFDEETHTYSIDGNTVPSVTQLLGNNYQNVNKYVLERASKRGIAIHEEIELFIKYEAYGGSHEFLEFYKLYLKNEEIFKSKCVMDIKTYNTMTKEALQRVDDQTKLYVDALKWTIGDDDEYDRYVIWLPKDKEGKLIKL